MLLRDLVRKTVTFTKFVLKGRDGNELPDLYKISGNDRLKMLRREVYLIKSLDKDCIEVTLYDPLEE